MTHEVQVTAFACDKCNKRSFRRSEIAEHETNCGVGVIAKPGDKIVNMQARSFNYAIVKVVSGKAIRYIYPEDKYASEHEAVGDSGFRLYDETIVRQMKELMNHSEDLEKEASRYNDQARELFKTLKPAWGDLPK